MPQPTAVTRNVSSGCCLAQAMKCLTAAFSEASPLHGGKGVGAARKPFADTPFGTEPFVGKPRGTPAVGTPDVATEDKNLVLAELGDVVRRHAPPVNDLSVFHNRKYVLDFRLQKYEIMFNV